MKVSNLRLAIFYIPFLIFLIAITATLLILYIAFTDAVCFAESIAVGLGILLLFCCIVLGFHFVDYVPKID